MFKLFSVFVLTAILCVRFGAGEITVTFEPYNETEDATLYERNNLHVDDSQQHYDDKDVETFYIQSDLSEGDERRGDIPITHTHSPIKEPVEPQTEKIPTSQPNNCPPTEPAKECPRCCEQPFHTINRPTYIQYPAYSLFPSRGGQGSHASVIDDDAEYINTGNGGQQFIFVNRPQQPDPPQFPEFTTTPAFRPQQPPHPSIIYIPYHPLTPTGSEQLPDTGNAQGGGNIGGDINFGISGGASGGGGGFDHVFTGGSPHRNHEQLWRHHQQQHQLWLQRQKQQQQNQFGLLYINGGGVSTNGNIGSIGAINGGSKRPCDSKK